MSKTAESSTGVSGEWVMRDIPAVKVEVYGHVWTRLGMMGKQLSVLYKSLHDGELTSRTEQEFLRLFKRSG